MGGIPNYNRRNSNPNQPDTTSATSQSTIQFNNNSQYALIYDLISEGEISGLVEGAKSVFLNGTRLTDTASASSVSPIGTTTGTFTASSTTVTASGGLSGTLNRLIILERGGKRSSTFSGTSGSNVLNTGSAYFENSMVGGSTDGAGPATTRRIRVDGLGPNGREYIGTIVKRISDTSAEVSPAISTTGSGKSGGIDHLTVVTAVNSSSSITVAQAPQSSGTKFQIVTITPNNTIQAPVDDRWNFKNVTLDFRAGSREQSIVEKNNLPTASFLTSIGEELLWGLGYGGEANPLAYNSAALGVATDPSEVDKIKLGIEFPGGLYVNTGEKAKIRKTFMGIRVEFRYTQGGVSKSAVIVGPASSAGWPTPERGFKWSEFLVNKGGIIGESTSPFVQDIEFSVEKFKPFTDFSILVTRTTPNISDDVPTNDNTYIFSARLKYIELQVVDKFSYPLSAYAAMSFPAEGFANLPTRSYHVRGLKIKVPSNYITREESADSVAKYIGQWNGTFITKYTNNPAWVFYDLATNNRYGLGKYIDPTLIDKFSLYRIARYCDELVPNGKGGQEPRFTCNVYIFEAEEAYKLMRDLASTFRALTYWAQGSLITVQDSPKEAIYTFTQGNVIDGIFNYEYSGRNARYNEINVTWTNPDQFYQQDVLTVTDHTNVIKRGRVVPMDTLAFGCTSESQAYRVANWNLLTSQLETEFISFGTGINASFLLPGDIINVQDHHLEAVQASGRVRSAASASSITLDRNVTLTAGSTYKLHLVFDGPGCYLQQASATIGGTTYTRGDLIPGITTSEEAATLVDSSNNPVAVSFSAESHVQTKTINNSLPYTGNTITVSSAFSSVPSTEVIWAIENATLDSAQNAKQYRILNIKEEENHTYSIVGVLYAPEKFEELEAKVKTAVPPFSGPRPGDDVPPVTNLNVVYTRTVLDEDFEEVDSTYYALISWTPPEETYTDSASNSVTRAYPHVVAYQIEYSFFDIPSTQIKEYVTEEIAGDRNSLRVFGVAPGTYDVRVRVKNSIGEFSPWVSRTLTLEADSSLSGAQLNGLQLGGALDTATRFTDNTYSITDTFYTYTAPNFRVYSIEPATSAQSAQSFAGLSASSEYYLLWDSSNTEDPLKAVAHYEDTNVASPYGATSSYWRDAYAAGDGMEALPGTISASQFTNKVTGTSTFFESNLAVGNFIKLYDSSNDENSFYTVVTEITSNTELYTREIILKNFTNKQIQVPTYRVNYRNDVILAKIVTDENTVASLEAQYVTTTVDEPQFLDVLSNGQTFTYYANNELIGPQQIDFTVNKQNIIAPTEWELRDSEDNLLSNTYLDAMTNTSATLNANSFGSITNNSFVQVTAKALDLSDTVLISKLLYGQDGLIGEDAVTIRIAASRQIFTFDANNDFKPSGQAIVLTASKQNSTNTVNWTSSPSVNLREGVSPSSPIVTTGDTVYLYIEDFGFENEVVEFTATLDGTEIFDKFSIYKLREGREGHTIILSNENHSIPLEYSGFLGSYLGSGTDIRVWEGITPLIYSDTVTSNATFNVSVLSNTGITPDPTPTTITTVVTDDTRRYGNASNLTSTTASIVYRIGVRDKFDNYITYDRQQSFSGVREGAPGANAVSFTVVSNEQIFTFNSNNDFKPAGQYINFTALKQNDTNTVAWTTTPSVNLRATTNPASSIVTEGDSVYMHIGDFGKEYSNVTVRGSLTGTTLYDEITVYKLRDTREAHTLIMTNENHTIPTDSDGINGDYANSGTDFRVYEGVTPLVYNVSAGAIPSFNVEVVSNTGIAVNTSPTTVTTIVTNDTRRYGNTNNITANTATIVYRVTVRDKFGDYSSYTRQQSFSAVKDGIVGADGADGADGVSAKAVNLTSNAQGIEYNAANNRVGPASVLFSATPQNNVGEATYRFYVNDVAQGGGPSTTNTFTYTTPTTYFSAPIGVEVELYDATVLVARDQTSLYAIRPGSDVLSAILSNEAHTIPTDSDGNNGNYTGSGTTIKAFEGTSALIYESGTGFPTIDGRFRIVATVSSITAGAISGSGTNTATVAIASNMTADVASISYAINARNSLGQNLTLTKVQTFSKSKEGETGNDAVTLRVLPDGQLFTFNSNNDYSPTGQFITIRTSKQNSTNAVNWTTVPTVTLRATSSPSGTPTTANDTVYLHIGDFGKSISNVTITGTLNGTTISDVVTIYKVRETREAHTIVLSNESHSIPVDSAGLNGNYTGSGTDIRVWEGTTPLVYSATGVVVPSFNVVVASNTSIRVNTSPTTVTTVVTNDTRRYGNASNITANTATIVYTIGVRDKFGNFSTYSRQQSFSAVRAGAQGPEGDPGDAGTPAVSMFLSRAGVTLFAYANGGIQDYSDASGQAELYSGSTRVTESATWSRVQSTGLTGTVLNTTGNKGRYSVTKLNDQYNTGTLTINASYQGQIYTSRFSVAKAIGGYQIVSSLPTTNLFDGRVVYLTQQSGANPPDKLYRYIVPTGWTASVPNVDISGTITSTQIGANAVTTPKIAAGSVNTAQLAANAVTANKIAAGAVTADQIFAGAVTAAKINVTELSGISANLGIVNTGLIQGLVGNFVLDVNNSKLYSTKTSYTDDTSGYFIGIDSSVPALYIGNATSALKFKEGVGTTVVGPLIATENIQLNAVSDSTYVKRSTSLTLTTTMQQVLDMTLPETTVGKAQKLTVVVDADDTSYAGDFTTINATIGVYTTTGTLVQELINNRSIGTFSDEGTRSGWSTAYEFVHTPTSTNRRYRVFIRQVDTSYSILQPTTFIQSEALKR